MDRDPFWCPRCDVPAPPWKRTEGAGWCPICGLDPLVEGPVVDKPKLGLSALVAR